MTTKGYTTIHTASGSKRWPAGLVFEMDRVSYLFGCNKAGRWFCKVVDQPTGSVVTVDPKDPSLWRLFRF